MVSVVQDQADQGELWLRGLWYDGTTYGFPRGLSKELNQQLALWCQANNVKQKGLKLPKA